jgi:hypothetical protein
LRLSAQADWFEPNQGQVHRSLYFGRNRMAVRDVRMEPIGTNGSGTRQLLRDSGTEAA